MNLVEKIGEHAQATSATRLEETKVEVQDRQDQRQFDRRKLWADVGLYAFLGALLVTVIVYALYLNKDGFASEIIKMVLAFGIGGAGGYGFGIGRRRLR